MTAAQHDDDDEPTDANVCVEVEPISRFDWERVVKRWVVLSGSETGVALMLATFADPDGSRIFPGQELLARVTGHSESTIKRAMKRLRREGLIVRTKQGDRHKNESNEYRLTVPTDIASRPLLDPDYGIPPHLVQGSP